MSSAVITDSAVFQQKIQNNGLAVAHFEAAWAMQCKQLNKVLEELEKQTEGVAFLRVEAESVPEISLQHKVIAVPTFLLFRNGAVVDRIDGAKASDLTKKVRELAGLAAEGSSKQDLNNRLKALINKAPCMLFMKGDRHQPKCGFSRQILAILEKHNAQFQTFDILEDEEVRQGLKEYSQWPTYPQLYVSGQLVGGVDIVKEMDEANEFAAALPQSQTLDDRLKSLIEKAPVMVFMKGGPKEPKCGFSRQLVTILQEQGVQYDHFDILTDEDVRQGLKTFSNWPTYPQVYVNGELIGGLDIIKELNESGELASSLNPSKQ